MFRERKYIFGKGKGKPIVVIPGRTDQDKTKPPEKTPEKQPPPSSTQNDASKKWHLTRGQSK